MDINSIKRKLLIKYPFFGSVIANAKLVEQEEIGTAATDGTNICYNPKFLETLNESQQIFVFAHEISHIAFKHIERSENKNKFAWNLATDAVVNALLKNDGLELVDGVVDIPEAINCDAEEMYKIIMKELNKKQEEEKSDKENSKNENNSNQNVGHDDHSNWQDVIEKKKQKDNSSNEEKSNTSKSEISNSDEPNYAELGEKEAFKKNKEEKERQIQELSKSLARESQAGTDAGKIKKDIRSIGAAPPIIDWRKQLKESVNFNVDWSYSNATIEYGVLTPQLEELTTPETEIVLDTSGSIDDELLKTFLRECKNILQSSKVRVGCFDTEFYGFHEIKSVEDIDKLEFEGGGGTNFDVAVDAFSRRVDNKIIFTDGCAGMPNKALDAIWIVFKNRINPPGGKVIYVSEQDLRESAKKLNIKKRNER